MAQIKGRQVHFYLKEDGTKVFWDYEISSLKQKINDKKPAPLGVHYFGLEARDVFFETSEAAVKKANKKIGNMWAKAFDADSTTRKTLAAEKKKRINFAQKINKFFSK